MATSSTQTTASQRNSNELKPIFMEKLRKKICCFYDEQSLIDVTFKVSNPEAFILAHRLILSAASPYFENLFNSDRGNTPVIEIKDIDSDIFKRLITFCYTGQALVTVDNASAMVKAAIVLQLEDAATTCEEYLSSRINECNVNALENETKYELLKQRILEYQIQHFMEISQRDEFLNFDVKKLKCLIESDILNLTCEEDAYDAITRWFNHNVSERQQHLPSLVACLRLTQFDVHFLLTRIQSLPGCELLALQAYTWISNPSARTMINIRFTEPRVGLGARNCDEKTLLVVYRKRIAENPCVLQYNKAEDKWQKYADLTENNSLNSNAILKDGNLLFIGGDRFKSPSKRFLSWNIENKTWRELPEMNQARQGHSVVELNGKIYAIGGRGENNTLLQSVERYTAFYGWEFVAPLFTARRGAGAVTFDGKICIMGGFNRNKVKSVECYNPDSNSWNSCADMAYNHLVPGAAAHNGHIYVVGDFKGNPAVERYDPQRDTWSQICSRNDDGWCGFACATLDNALWTIGGRVEEGRIGVAVYNEANVRWVEKSLLPPGVICSCFVAPLSLLT